jgi:Fe2+ transport system protein FeoA
MVLEKATEGCTVLVERFTEGGDFAARMNSYGIFKGKLLKVIRAAPFRGPILLEDAESGARVMLGRGMARKIEVSVAKRQ